MNQTTNQGVMNSDVANVHIYNAGDNQTRSKPGNQCFISHTIEDKKLAELIKSAIRTLVDADIPVFVDSDADSIEPGKKWSEQIKGALQQTTYFIVIMSEHSSNKPWISIEIGAAWGQGANILPICYGSVTSKHLSTPLSEYQAVSLASMEDDVKIVSFIERVMHLFEIKNINLAKVNNFYKSYKNK